MTVYMAVGAILHEIYLFTFRYELVDMRYCQRLCQNIL